MVCTLSRRRKICLCEARHRRALSVLPRLSPCARCLGVRFRPHRFRAAVQRERLPFREPERCHPRPSARPPSRPPSRRGAARAPSVHRPPEIRPSSALRLAGDCAEVRRREAAKKRRRSPRDDNSRAARTMWLAVFHVATRLHGSLVVCECWCSVLGSAVSGAQNMRRKLAAWRTAFRIGSRSSSSKLDRQDRGRIYIIHYFPLVYEGSWGSWGSSRAYPGSADSQKCNNYIIILSKLQRYRMYKTYPSDVTVVCTNGLLNIVM